MPLPLCHTAFGLTTYELFPRDGPAFSGWKVAVFVAVLANLPDIYVLIGLLFQGNGNASHRGPTHSLLLALFTGCLVPEVSKLSSKIPKLSPSIHKFNYELIYSGLSAE